MIKHAVFVVVCSISVVAFADHHEPSGPTLAEIYDCQLNDGVSVGNAVEYARTAFKGFADEHDLAMRTFIWEAVAVNQPYDEPDIRWVNYYPSWSAYYAADEKWRAKGGDVAMGILDRMVCSKSRITRLHRSGEVAPRADEKPMIALVCNLKEGKTIQDAIDFRTSANTLSNDLIEGTNGSFILTPMMGISGFDYVSMVTGTHTEMAAMMDNVRTGKYREAMREAGLENPGSCVVDLHKSHLIIAP